jgi:hypothetical protein
MFPCSTDPVLDSLDIKWSVSEIYQILLQCEKL